MEWRYEEYEISRCGESRGVGRCGVSEKDLVGG